MDDFTDHHLVKQMLAGDESAFDEFFADYFPRLFRFAVMRLHDHDAAEDVVQSALIIAVRRLDTWRGEAALFTWLCTICRREISAHVSRPGQRRSVPMADDDPEVRSALESLGAALDGPDAAVERDDTGRLVQMALDYLPPRYSRVLEWKYLEDLTIKNIADRLETTPKAAESLLARAREAFRESFTALCRQVGETGGMS